MLSGVAIFLLFSSCTITATRPVQEMSNADAALRAAKDLHADSLVPEIYRNATESYYKAKREYKLKNFDASRKLALKAQRLAEQAEFEAYRLGGATPEIINSATTEGAPPDPDEALRNHEEAALEQEEKAASQKSKEPKLEAEPAEPPPGVDYDTYVQQQEEQKKREEEKAKEKTGKPGEEPKPVPEGARGPTLPSLYAQNNTRAVPDGLAPQTGTLPGSLPGADQVNSREATPTPKIDTDRWILQEDSKPKTSDAIPDLGATTLPDMNAKDIPSLGQDAVPEQEGLENAPESPMREIDDAPSLYVEGEKKK